MRSVICYIASSLDGYIARPDGSLDWLPLAGGEEDYGYAEFYASVDTILMGRKTYDLVKSFGTYPYEGKEAYVFSRSQGGQNDRHARFISDDPGVFISEVKRKSGRDIWLVGGGQILRAVLEAGQLDLIILTIIPILIGSGIPLFPATKGDHPLRLVRSRAYPNGLVQVEYQVI